MHLGTLYSLTSGQRLTKPKLNEKFFPLSFTRYVSFSPYSKPAKSPSYWNTVMDILIPILDKAGIKVVQLGAAGETPIRGTHYIAGQTSIGQCAYLIKNAELHLSCDTFSVHIASLYDTPTVAVYSTNYLENVKGFWHSPEKVINLEPEDGLKPSFAFDEPAPKRIDKIPPEKIAASVCKLLGLEFNFPFRTIHIGPQFERTYIEGIPNQACQLNQLNTEVIILRMDEVFSEQVLLEQAKISKVVVVTNQSINLDLLKAIKPQILEVAYEVKEVNDPVWVQKVQRLGIKIGLFSFLSDDELNKHKLKYLDLPLINQKKIEKPAKLNGIDPKNIFVSSNRFVLSNGKIYPSIQHYKQDISIPQFGMYFSPLIDTPEFYAEDGAFWYVEKVVA